MLSVFVLVYVEEIQTVLQYRQELGVLKYTTHHNEKLQNAKVHTLIVTHHILINCVICRQPHFLYGLL